MFANDRVSSMPHKHHALAYGFRFDAATRTLSPVTRELLAFEHGIDDTVKFPWVSAGYSTEYVPANSTDVTNTYGGGAWSPVNPTMLTGITITFPTIARIVPASVVKRGRCEHNPSVEYVAFPRGGGDVLPDTATVAELQGVLTDALLHGGETSVLPPGRNTSCSLLAGPARYLRGDSGTVAWRPRGEIFCEPIAKRGADFNPNRFLLVFRENVRSIPWPADLAAPADGSYVVIDFDVRCEVAEVEFIDEGSDYVGVSPQDKRLVAAYRAAFGTENAAATAATPEEIAAIAQRGLTAST